MYSLPSYWDYCAKEEMGNRSTLYYFSHCCTCFVLFSSANPLKISSLWQDERNEMMKLSIWVRQVSTKQQLLDLNSYGYCLTKASFTALPFLFFVFIFYPTLAWENNRYFATLPTVSARNDVWGTSAEIPYWWPDTTLIWFVENLLQPIRSTNHMIVTRHQCGISALVPQTLFSVVASRSAGCFLRLSLL